MSGKVNEIRFPLRTTAELMETRVEKMFLTGFTVIKLRLEETKPSYKMNYCIHATHGKKLNQIVNYNRRKFRIDLVIGKKVTR